MRREIELFDYANTIMQALSKGVLLTTKADGKVNTMTISWGTLGIQWGKPIFTVFVRKSRHTMAMLEKNAEFTINIPYGQFDKQILAFCGKYSGRDTDKIAQLGLHTQDGVSIDVPAIRELPLTLECKVIYQQSQSPEAIEEESDARFYAKGSANEGDYHTAYYGQITTAYILED